MGGAEIGLIVAFLGPPPPPRRGGPDRPDAPRMNAWLLGVIAWFLLVVTLMPLSLALSDGRRASTASGAACRAAGGRVTYDRPTEGRNAHCER